MTQRGRIEAALKGVRLNTDAIDNSAGVNTSDVEVNIKIALSLPVRDGRLTLKARNTLLGKMTDEVAALVLRNNYLQTLALSLAERRGLEDLGFQQRLMQTLEQRGELDRAVEFLPDDMEIAERVRRQQPLTRPELSVLLAYAKLSLYADLLDSNGAGRSLSRPRARPLFPEADRAEISRCAGEAPAAPRDHLDAARQLDDQPRRAVAGGADRRSDRRVAGRDRVRLRRGAQQLRHAGAERRDQRARRQAAPARCSSSSTPPCRTCCSTGWSGSCATPTCRRAGRRRRTLSQGHRGAERRARQGAAQGRRRGARGAHQGTGRRRRAGGARPPHRRHSGDRPRRPTWC